MYAFLEQSCYYKHYTYQFIRQIGSADYIFFVQDTHESLAISFNAYMIMVMSNDICATEDEAREESKRRFVEKLHNGN